MKVVTAVVNNPQFIELQYYTLARYMKCDYEFIVFNDAKAWPDFSNGHNPAIYNEIQSTCANLGVQCINLENSAHMHNQDASARTADAHNTILAYMIANPDQYLVIDSDMFLIDDFDGSKFKTKSAAISLQCRDSNHYIWNGLYYFDMLKMAKVHLLNWNKTHNTDTGGQTEIWLEQMTGGHYPSTDSIRWEPGVYETDTLCYIKHLWSCSWDSSELPTQFKDRVHLREFLDADPRNKDGKYFAEIYEDCFFHYRAGGNWRGEGMDLHGNLTSRLMGALLGDF